MFEGLYPIQEMVSQYHKSTSDDWLIDIYGQQPLLIEQKKRFSSTIIQAFHQQFPHEKECALLRVPARVNLMGVHIDHQGGNTNYVPISNETIFCLSPRTDGKIVVKNLNSMYEDFSLSPDEELPPEKRGRWMEVIESPNLIPGFWGNYIKAGALKIQDAFPEWRLHGMNLLVAGDIPANAGVSSSSTLVVGIVMALCKINQLPITKDAMVDLCGEGEWLVGTRGGAGDHAAMLLGKRGSILHAGFKPFQYQYFDFPEDCEILLIVSGIESKKATGSRRVFNSRIAAYETAFLIFQTENPSFRDRLNFLRDVNPESLGVSGPQLCSMMQCIPIAMRRAELLSRYPRLQPELSRIFSRFQIGEEKLPLREVFLFGVFECLRARQFPTCISQGKKDDAGRLMYLSHDGDRVSTWDAHDPKPYRSLFDDLYLHEIAKTGCNLAMQPGGYRCSVPQVDRVVDFCKTIPSIHGAGLTGAGLGGSIVALVDAAEADSAQGRIQNFIRNELNPNAFVQICFRTEGASFLSGAR
jgi:N-acetylgalactosamine kinase